jgi:endogenous inhibitor of DNA gyrase (YacG/DUF329 family)
MCFYFDDYEWTAELIDTKEGPDQSTVTCDECGKNISRGEWRKTVYQQEHEDTSCQFCDGGKADDGDECGDCDGTGERGPGNTFEYHCCEPCEKILRAIETLEIAEGCRPPETRPGYGFLQETLTSTSYDDREKYVAKAIEMFPEIADHVRALRS